MAAGRAYAWRMVRQQRPSLVPFLTVALALAVAAWQTAQAAVPPGYRYIGSRAVSAGRVVLWYWNVDSFDPGGSPVAFTARLYARAPDVNQERPYVAIVRCDNRTYKGIDDSGPFQAIDAGEPIDVVWRAGCAGGIAVAAAQRHARLAGTALPADAAPPRAAEAPPAATRAEAASSAPLPRPEPATPSSRPDPPPAPASPANATSTTTPTTAATRDDPRRADACLRFKEARAPMGDASLTNTCGYAIEVALCYKGNGGSRFDCPAPPRGRHLDSLGPGVTHVLPEFRLGRHRGITAIACRGAPGSVLPRLEDEGRCS